MRFFRPLGVGDRGDDVLQLKQILAAAGDNPGPMDTVFTEQTQFALAQWQAQHHYPGATPVAPQSVTVSLAQGAGLHARRPDRGRAHHRPGGRADDARRDRGRRRTTGVLTAFRPTTRRPRADAGAHDPVGRTRWCRKGRRRRS